MKLFMYVCAAAAVVTFAGVDAFSIVEPIQSALPYKHG